MRHLILVLEAPLMSFGGETVDNLGIVRAFPAVSMLTGLLANALGLRRVDREIHQSLQDRLVFAARIDREPHGGLGMRDFQTAEINKTEQGWTTRGRPEGRKGGTFRNYLRYRDYFADMLVTVALRLKPESEEPSLEDVGTALLEPARPLFVGRKPCIPSVQLFAGYSEGDTALAALLAWPLADEASGARSVRTIWPDGEGTEGIEANRRYMLTDQRNWMSGLHGGGRAVCEGSVGRDLFPSAVTDNVRQLQGA